MSNRTKYGIVIVQRGDGCDYTIGCGTCFDFLKAETLEEARVEARLAVQGRPDPGYVTGYDGYLLLDESEQLNLRAVYLVVLCESLQIQPWYDELMQNKAAHKQAKADEKERAEFERLKQKFGDR